MRAFLTGATGLVGSHVALQLALHGHSLRALVRPGSDAAALRRLGAELVVGDLLEPHGLVRALSGVDVVLHNAGLVGEWGDWRAFDRLAAGGTRALLSAAERAGVARFVHTSSAVVYGLLRAHGRVVDEGFGLERRYGRWSAYARAKVAAEDTVAEAASRGLATVILRPTVVYGPGDRAVLPRLASLLRAGRLRLVGSPENRLHVIFARDVAEAALAAATVPGAAGQAYNLDGPGDVTQRVFLGAVARMLDLPPPVRGIPLYPAYALGFLHEAWGHLRRRKEPPPLTRFLAALAGGPVVFDTRKARRELGFEPRTPAEEGLRLTEAWLRGEARAAAA